MAKPTARIGLIQVMLALGFVVVVGRAAQLQIIQGGTWRARADSVRREKVVLPARRGGIYDRNGVQLAVTQEYFEVGVAPNELRSRGADTRAIAKALGIPAARLARDVATKKWIALPGPYTGLQVQPLRDIDGVHLYGEFKRHYPAGSLARGVIGAFNADSNRGASGVEMALDSILTGIPGEAVMLKDRSGRRYDSPSRRSAEPVPGGDVRLTLDAELQEIAERALDEAMQEYEAAGGDIVILDPRTGELLAIASRQTVGGKVLAGRASFFTDPYEPGSTAKLFTAGALLARQRVEPTETVFAENGLWEMPVNSRGATRLIHDEHKSGNVTLAQAVQASSNIGMAKFSTRLSAVEQFESLRAFGFGSPSGVEYPSESRGGLRMPSQWDGYSKASIAMGYEFQVTPVQLAAAYGAIANDGILLTPTLVREVRDPSAKVIYEHQPEPVRRAVSPEVARQLREYLRSVMERGGTAEASQMSNYSLAGKTGTARRSDARGYIAGSYTASFAAIFPADDPMLVVVVKIDDPKGAKYHGGQTAAPVTRAMLEEALAARRSAIDRNRLLGSGSATIASAAQAPASRDDRPAELADTREEIVPLPLQDAAPARSRTLVPAVKGNTLRRAANALHRRGFQVAIHGTGSAVRTTPAAGDSAWTGSTITIWAE
jgi:cell division protein FtsI (penicillin-binding protein 3)